MKFGGVKTLERLCDIALDKIEGKGKLLDMAAMKKGMDSVNENA